MTRALVAIAVLSACRSSPPPPAVANAPAATVSPATPAPAPATAARSPTDPPEPWYLDQPEAYADCVPPSDAPATPLPAPFERCDGTAEGWASPPGGNELHFHYREFSASVTRERRARDPDICCYLVFEFPHFH